MKRKGGTKREKVKSTGVPSLLLGIFLGFLIGLVAVGGVGTYLYFNVSVNWLNSAFNTNYDLGNNDLNNTTISEFVTHVIGLVDNLDSYTLNDLEIDFGIEIKDEMCGIDISSIKNVPLTQLEEAVGNMTVSDMFGEQADSGILSLVKDSTLTSLATDLSDVLTSSTLDELINCGAMDKPSNYDNISNMYLKVNFGTDQAPTYKKVSELTIKNLIDAFDYILNAEASTYLSQNDPAQS